MQGGQNVRSVISMLLLILQTLFSLLHQYFMLPLHRQVKKSGSIIVMLLAIIPIIFSILKKVIIFPHTLRNF